MVAAMVEFGLSKFHWLCHTAFAQQSSPLFGRAKRAKLLLNCGECAESNFNHGWAGAWRLVLPSAIA
jgi:hypothetical protein